MRIVLDTNVVVSGDLNPRGAPGRCLDLVLEGSLILLHDDRIVAEYLEVLRRPRFALGSADVESLVAFLAMAGEAISSNPLRCDLPDPDDLPFLEVAVAGRADALITGNRRHFPDQATSHGVEVVSPAELVRRVSG